MARDSRRYMLIQCEVFGGASSGDTMEMSPWFYDSFEKAHAEMVKMFLAAFNEPDMDSLREKFPDADWDISEDGYDVFFDEEHNYSLDRDTASIPLDSENPEPMTLQIFEI